MNSTSVRLDLNLSKSFKNFGFVISPSNKICAGSPLDPEEYSWYLSRPITKSDLLSKKSFTSNSDFKFNAPIAANIVITMEIGSTT